MSDDLRNMTGQARTASQAVYKLNEVTMNGDDGSFRLREILAPKNADGKFNIEQLGDELSGVILKMRWKLSKYEEGAPSLNSTEYDDKFKDQVTLYPMRDKGNVVALKERYNLTTQRVIYFYLPKKQQIVRLIVKSSAFKFDDTEVKELGLFQYIDDHNDANTAVHEYLTVCKGVFRKGKNADGTPNKRKDHYAMSFSAGAKLSEEQLAKVEQMIRDVHQKTAPARAEEVEVEEQQTAGAVEYPKDDINPDDIPF